MSLFAKHILYSVYKAHLKQTNSEVHGCRLPRRSGINAS